ncbi:putative protein kinase RLK-Pelle-RLCK-VIIa-2 family [Helianthus annuus]|nr:putative protein kinase RLK-Pelle-RLCK-VIIa-2 family [Helianthus annuus]
MKGASTLDFNAKLSDFGLTRLGPVNGESHVTTRVMGTYGYVMRLLSMWLLVSRLYVKSDVYGFGVVMLEIITGLRTLDPSRHVSKHKLVDWARPLLSDKKRIHRVMDSRLEKKYPMKAAHKTAELILTCLEPDPKNRPSMEEIVSCLQGINAIKMEPSQSTANTIKGQAINEVA